MQSTLTDEVYNSTDVCYWRIRFWWPGKAKWCEEVIAKALLLGAEFEYRAVSSWDYDEAWVVRCEEGVVASSRKVTTAIGYLKVKGIDV